MAQLPTQPNLLGADLDSNASEHSRETWTTNAQDLKACISRMFCLIPDSNCPAVSSQQKNKEMSPSIQEVGDLLIEIANKIFDMRGNSSIITEEDVTNCHNSATTISQIVNKYSSIPSYEVIIITNFCGQVLKPIDWFGTLSPDERRNVNEIYSVVCWRRRYRWRWFRGKGCKDLA